MDDLISRAAACECIGKMIHEYREKGEGDLADGMILARRYGIKCLPAVDAIPVEWLQKKRKYASEGDSLDVGIAEVLDMWEKEQGAR